MLFLFCLLGRGEEDVFDSLQNSGLRYVTKFSNTKPQWQQINDACKNFSIFSRKDSSSIPKRYTCFEYCKPYDFKSLSLTEIVSESRKKLQSQCIQWVLNSKESFTFCNFDKLIFNGNNSQILLNYKWPNSPEQVFLPRDDSLTQTWISSDDKRLTVDYKCDPVTDFKGTIDSLQILTDNYYRITYVSSLFCNYKSFNPTNLSITKCFPTELVNQVVRDHSH